MAQITANQGVAASHAADAQHEEHNGNIKLAMWLYLASEVVIFSVLIVGYIIFRMNQPEAVNIVHENLGILLVSANTFILLASSYAMVMALRAIEMGNKQQFMLFMGLTALMGIAFLGGQYLEYDHLGHVQVGLQNTATTAESELFEGLAPEEVTDDLVAAAGNFGMRFYAPTAFHGAHVLVGVFWAFFVLWRGWRGHYDDNAIGVEIFGLYWHFVDVVWIVLFTLIYLV